MIRWFQLFLVALAICTPVVVAQAAGFDVTVQGGRELTLAVPTPQTPSGDPDKVAALIRDTLERDLSLTGYFEIVPPAAHLERGRGVEPGTFAFEDWKPIRVAALVKTRILPPGVCEPGSKRMCLDVFVYDVLGGTKIAGKRMLASAGDARALAHEAANAVLEALVGEPGFFTGTLLAVHVRGENKEIYLIDIGGADPRPITRNGSINLSPALSPNGRDVAWTSYRRGNPDVYVKNLNSGQVRALSSGTGLDISPAFSPDGRTIALARSVGGDTDLFLIDAQTGREIRRLTQGGGIDVSPHFSPDGSQIVFASERSGGSQIYVVPTTGGTPRRVTTMGGFFTDPVWSPDGQRIAFVSRKGSFDVVTVKADGSGLVRITQDMGDNEDPTWSPDGRYLVFSSTRKGRSQLWLSTANGRHQVALTDSGTWTQPVWAH